MPWLQALSFGELPRCPSENDQGRQDLDPCVPTPRSDSKSTFSSRAKRWLSSLASLPCCNENLVGLIIRSGEVDESLSC